LLIRWPKSIKPGSEVRDLVILQDIAPTLLEIGGGKPGEHIQGRSLLPVIRGKRAGWRKSFLVEYWAENAYPWLVGMSFRAIRTDRYKYIHWVNRARNGELDELYDLQKDPYELINLAKKPAYAAVRKKMTRDLRALAADALGL
jgi:N-acetylglucosamine-6-sulfatase